MCCCVCGFPIWAVHLYRGGPQSGFGWGSPRGGCTPSQMLDRKPRAHACMKERVGARAEGASLGSCSMAQAAGALRRRRVGTVGPGPSPRQPDQLTGGANTAPPQRAEDRAAWLTKIRAERESLTRTARPGRPVETVSGIWASTQTISVLDGMAGLLCETSFPSLWLLGAPGSWPGPTVLLRAHCSAQGTGSRGSLQAAPRPKLLASDLQLSRRSEGGGKRATGSSQKKWRDLLTTV